MTAVMIYAHAALTLLLCYAWWRCNADLDNAVINGKAWLQIKAGICDLSVALNLGTSIGLLAWTFLSAR